MVPAPAPGVSSSVLSALRNRRALYAPVLAIAAFGLVACSGKPENSPVIRKKFAEVDAMKEDLNTAVAELRAATGEITLLREQVSEVRAFAPDGEGATAVISRIEAIENRLAALTSSQGQTRTVAQGDSSERSGSGSSGSASSGGSSGGSESSSFGGLATSSGASGDSGRSTASSSNTPTDSFRQMTNPRSTAPARSETAAARPSGAAATGTGASAPATAQQSPANRGRYHTIETGDTLEKIARDNNIGVDALREANRLPAGARPLRGQRLFIPPARQ